MVEVVSARVDEDTRRRMRRLPQVNWSEVIREATQRRLSEEERRREVDPSELKEAAKITDEIRRPSPPGWESTEEIRRWREGR